MMWEKIAELFVGKSLECLAQKRAPRRRLAVAFVALLNSMKKCHEEYLSCARLRYIPPAGNMNDDDFELLDFYHFHLERSQDWYRSIENLAKSLNKLRVILEIHEPSLLSALDNYRICEEASRLWNFELETRDRATKEIAHRIYESDMWTEEKQSEVEFESALLKLREFMRDRLKLTPEELIDVSNIV